MENIFTIKFKFKVLTQIILGYFWSFLNLSKKDKKYDFPLEIGGYKFVEEFKPQTKAVTGFKIGIYEDADKNRAIAKIYYQASKNIEYYWLINEIKVYLGFNYLYAKYGKQIKERFPDISVPRMIDCQINQDETILLTEFLEGENIENLSPKKEAVILNRVLEYFYFLGKFSNDKNLNKFFIKRGNCFYLMGASFYALKTIFRFPSLTLKIFSAYLFFIFNFINLFKQRNISIVHRDLNLRNILMDKKNDKINIIDFGLTICSNRLFDMVAVNKRAFIVGELSEELKGKGFMQKIIKDEINFLNFKTLSAYLAICVLAICPIEYKEDSYNYLKYVLNLKYEQ